MKKPNCSENPSKVVIVPKPPKGNENPATTQSNEEGVPENVPEESDKPTEKPQVETQAE